jgi:hypothetical protein
MEFLPMTLAVALNYAAIGASSIGAVLALCAARIKVRNSIDDFITDLGRQSRWTTYAALASCIAAGLSATQVFVH